MKYLRKFNESGENKMKYLKDIFLELEDMDFNVRIQNSLDNFHSSARFCADYKVTICNKVFKLSDIFELILTSESYMDANGWFIKSIRFRTYNGDASNNEYHLKDVEWFVLNNDDIQKLKNPDNLRKEVHDINYLQIEFKLQ
jgi:hypothetical protein